MGPYVLAALHGGDEEPQLEVDASDLERSFSAGEDERGLVWTHHPSATQLRPLAQIGANEGYAVYFVPVKRAAAAS